MAPPARINLHQFGSAVLGNLAAQAGRASQSGVVNDHQLAIGGKVQVQLYPADARFQCLMKTREGVFRGFAAGTAVTIN